MAQRPNDGSQNRKADANGDSSHSDRWYETQWDSLGKLLDEVSLNSAYDKACALFATAQKEHNSRQTLTGAFFLSNIEFSNRENPEDSALARYKSILPALKPVDQALCQAFLAQFYSNYRNANHWRIYENKETDQENLDYKLWPMGRFDASIRSCMEEALREVTLLRNTPSSTLPRFLERDENARNALELAPTLYDVLVNMAIEVLGDDAASYARKEALLNEQIAYHGAMHADDCLMISLYQHQLQLMSLRPNHGQGDEMALRDQLIDRFRGTQCPLLASLYFDKASNLNEKEDYVHAVAACEEGYGLFPKSAGGADCANLRIRITSPEITLQMLPSQPENHDMLAQVKVRNAHHLYFRIVNHKDHTDVVDERAFLAKQPVLRSWQQELDLRTDYSYQQVMSYLPAMPAGRYDVLVSHSADFAREGMVCKTITVCNALLISAGERENGVSLCLIDRVSGEPIKDVKVTLRRSLWRGRDEVLSTAITDREGLVTFPKSAVNYYSNTEYTYHGVTITDYNPGCPSQGMDTTAQWGVFLDRPVYKPGESVSFIAVHYKTDGHRLGRTLQGSKVKVALLDVNSKERSAQELVTDAFGQVHGSFVLPGDALPGNWRINLDGNAGRSFSVQYYKQPKYAVLLPVDSVEHQFGVPVEVKGSALSFTSMPVGGAKVEWSVMRRQMIPAWCRWWYMLTVSEAVTVADGNTVTMPDGSFVFSFVPQPDSDIDLSSKPCFAYVITARVTDVNGEVHEQTRTLSIGYENSGIVLSDMDQAAFDRVKYKYVNLDNQPLEGDMQILVEELQRPAKPKLPTGLDKGYSHSMSREEFERRYPLFAYSDDELYVSRWKVARTVLRTVHHASTISPNEVLLPELASGVYRVTISTLNGQGDTVRTSGEYSYTAPKERKVQNPMLLWYQMSARSAEVGDTITLRVGTSFKDVVIQYALAIDGVQQQYRRLRLSNEITTISIPVTEAMRGGFSISLFTVKEGIVSEMHQDVEVPYSNKKLDVHFVSFRDKLSPGQQETWTLQVDTPAAQDDKAANILLTMYDAALDTYGTLYWDLTPWRNNRNGCYLGYRYSNRLEEGMDYLCDIDRIYGKELPLSYYQLRAGSFYYHGIFTRQRRRYSLFRSATMKTEESEGLMVADGAADATLEEVQELERQPGGKGNNLAGNPVPKIAAQGAQQQKEPHGQSQPSPVLMRKNLSTLAFFAPTLRTDTAGRATLTFTVPELLTRWHVQGMAYNQQLMVGTVQTAAVTSKEIMIVPNVPRFLRQGDRMDFVVKVSNATDERQMVKVTLELTDAATGRNFFTQSQDHNIDGHSSCPTSFSFSVPDGISACTYRVVAQGQQHSDGEQNVIPVLTNRMLVTESMSMYINGKGDKHYAMQPLQRDLSAVKSGKNTTLQPHRLTVEFTAYPIWYAIQALPYVEDHANPSCIYLVNSIYANTLGSNIVQQNPEVEKVFAHWMQEEPEALTSKLQQNEDIKQTILQETPWLRDGTDETARMRRVSAFFDRRSLDMNISKNFSKLSEAQRLDGSWSWMPGGHRGSEYVTSYVLKSYGHMDVLQDKESRMKGQQGRMLRQALQYVDHENYKYYLECRKYPGCTPTNIDYLYMRSFYASERLTEKYQVSYDFFYKNALSDYRKFSDLYSQAQLALIFYRHGDTEAARDLIRRLKERSLVNDEMGMYWRDNVSGFFWNQRPIEVQSLLIEAFEEVTPQDAASPALMRQWLLKQKQTTNWNSDVATVNAIVALVGGKQAVLRDAEKSPSSVTIKVGGEPLTAPKQSFTGYQRQQWQGDSIFAAQADVMISKSTDGIAWGAMYWQYFEDLDKVPYSEMGIKLQKTIYRENGNGSLSEVQCNSNKDGDTAASRTMLKVGDKVRVRILIDCDRNLEYLELKDAHPAVFEPVVTESGWRWEDGLSYYTAVYNASTSFFIDRLEKGKYVLEYVMYVNGSGERLSCGNATVQCMYAPEFRCNTPGLLLTVRNK